MSFKLNKSEIEAINKLSYVLFEFSVQCNVVQNSLSEDQIILPSFRKWFSIGSRRLEHQSRVTYLRIMNEPADSKETMIKVINFLYNIYEVQRTISQLLVVGDAKTFEVLRKLKDENGSDLDWLIPFPGDWHILKNFQPVVFKLFGHLSLRSIVRKVGVKEGTLRLLSDCTNFKKKNVFLIQCFLAITRLISNAFFESESMEIDREPLVSLLLPMLIKLNLLKKVTKGLLEK